MKAIVYIGAICFLVGCTEHKVKKSTLVKENLKGTVHMVITSTYDVIKIDSGKTENQLIRIDTSIYNAAGNLTSLIEGRDSYAKDITNSRYNSDGDLIEEKHYTNLGDVPPQPVTSPVTGQVSFSPEKPHKMHLIDSTVYSTSGNTVEFKSYSAEGGLTFSGSYEYDNKGNMAQQEFTDSYGKETDTYQYDDNGNKLQVNSKSDKGEAAKMYSYNNKGDETEYKSYNEEGKLETSRNYKYHDYDKNGNWLSRTMTENDRFVRLEVREIK